MKRFSFLLAVFLLSPFSFRAEPAPSEIMNEVSIEPKLGATLPLDVMVRDENGQTVRLAESFGKRPVILAFVYYRCPMLCNEVLNGLVKALRALTFNAGVDFDVLAVSIDPAEMSDLALQKKEKYALAYGRPGTEAGWHFFTGDESAVRALTDAAGFRFKPVPESNDFAHASGVYILTPEGRVSRIFYGIEFSAKDIRLGLIDASQGKLGTAVDKFLLLCYHYDPATGKYGFVITNTLRVACFATVAILLGFIITMLRRERRRDKVLP